MAKQRKRWVKWLAAAAVLIACILVGGVFALDAAVNYTLKQLAQEEQLPAQGAGETPSPAPLQPSPGPNAETPAKPVTGANPQPREPGEQENVEPSASENTKEEQTPAPNSDEDSTKLTYSSQISTDKAEAVQEKVTTGEKAAVASALLSSFSADELRQFAAMAKDGITVDEKRAAKSLFLDRLSEEEYDRLIQIAEKYGLSQGKSYDDSLKEQR